MRLTLALILASLFAIGSAYSEDAKIIEIENVVRSAKGPEGVWTSAVPNQAMAIGDRLKTERRSRAVLKLTDLYNLRVDERTVLQLTSALQQSTDATLDLKAGGLFIFSREKSGEIDIRTPAANGALRGTQLHVQVGEDGTSRFQVMEGQVELANPQGKLLLNAGEAGKAEPGKAPVRTAVIEARNLLQWAMYYPAVLDPAELDLTAGERAAAARSLAAYRSGDLLAALETFPENAPASAGGRLYRAAVLLAVGRVDEAAKDLAAVPATHPGRRSLERMIAAVKFEEREAWGDEALATAGEAMAESYYRQSRSDLEGARRAAMSATRIAPENGYAWTRLAELEFSFGRSKAANDALATGLALGPRNAQAYALQGFIFSSLNCMEAAGACFQHAIDLDGALGNGWLGRGLVRIRGGDLAGGRADLQTAATVEPTVSIFHSYLGKAMGMDRRPDEARKDLDLARQLDPRDPTPLLYSALELQSGNRTNDAIGDLERSILLNDNRRVFRSQLLLDQDRAVRGANLARIYQNAGMQDVAVREATRAVESDYTNSSAHLFLANSFDALRDPKRIQLRNETPWFNELLISNLLSPVGGGPLSQFVSQQEYSKLLEADGLGGSLSSEWRSSGESRSAASLFGASGQVSFGIDAYFREDSGDRPNSEAELAELYGQLKWQPTPDDIFYFLGKWADQQSGDNFDTYDNLPLEPQVNFEESQAPGLLLAGWNHRWAPGSHTLFLAGRLAADQVLTNPSANLPLVLRGTEEMRPDFIQTNSFGDDEFTDPSIPPVTSTAPGELVYSPELLRAIQPYLGSGAVESVSTAPFAFATRRRFEVNSAEIQQIWQTERNLLLAGGRFQAGEFRTDDRLVVDRSALAGAFPTPAAASFTSVNFERMTLYAYDYWTILRDLTVIGGVSWDRMEHPENFRNPPVNSRQREDEELSGKFGFTYAPSRRFTLRGMYTEGMGGVTFDESVRLEPVQLAGFNQAYRTVISESIAGSVEAPLYKIWGLSAEGSLPTRTWWGASFNVIEQDVDRTVGAFTGYDFTFFPASPAYFADQLRQVLAYQEQSLGLTLNQLLGDEFAIGAGYRVTRSELQTSFPDLPAASTPVARGREEATLHELFLNANWNSPTGLFARLEANFYSQDLEDNLNGPVPPRPGDAFWQFNAMVGYRFNRNLCEVSAGVLNLGDADYRLSPLSPRGEIARDRTAVVRCRFSF